MRHSDARAIFKYWIEAPPENEMLALLAGVYVDWKPASAKPMTEEEARSAHMRSLEQRWSSGHAMNAKQFFEAMGGAAGVAMRMDGTIEPAKAINDFPGTVH